MVDDVADARLSVRPLPACNGMMRVVTMWVTSFLPVSGQRKSRKPFHDFLLGGSAGDGWYSVLKVRIRGFDKLGYAAHENSAALSFLKNTVSQHDSWKVQEILAMAFDNHCKIIGYEAALPTIQEWLASDCANVRRAVSEGLRVWTSRPYFKDNPQVAIDLLAAHKSDESEYVRKSVGNAIRDISKKHSALVVAELSTWDLSSKEVRQVYKLASKFIEK